MSKIKVENKQDDEGTIMLTPFKGQWRNFDSERLLNGVERVRTIYFGVVFIGIFVTLRGL